MLEASSRALRIVADVVKITLGDDPKRADRRQRAALGTVDLVDTVALPNRSDLIVEAWPCVLWDNDNAKAVLDLRWYPAVANPQGPDYKFDGFTATIRQEKASTLEVLRKTTCSFTSAINTGWEKSVRCSTPWRALGDGPYVADGRVEFDKANDASGWLNWALNASPSFP